MQKVKKRDYEKKSKDTKRYHKHTHQGYPFCLASLVLNTDPNLFMMAYMPPVYQPTHHYQII